MKKILIIFLAAFTISLSSCEEHLNLDSKDALSTQQALSTMSGVRSAVVGLYASLRSVNYYGRTLYIYGDLSGNDVYLAKANSNRYLPTFQRNFASNDADMTSLWTAVYSSIARANNIVNAVDAVSAPAGEKNVAKGEALFVRALGYFDLVRVFAKPFNQGNGSQLGVPIVLTSDISNYPSRNSVAEVYAQIIADLNAAKGLLATTTAGTKLTVSKYAASALLSRVHLYKGDFANAINEANLVTADPSFVITPAAELASFYSTPETAEEIFTLKFMAVESLGSNNIGAMYLKPGYGDIRISPDLINTFDRVNDLRYVNFISQFSGSPTEFQNNKFTSQDNINFMHSPKILRLAEVLLNRAEAYYRQGQGAQALIDLNKIRTNRGLPALVGITGQALFDQILLERRHEFMFEGHNYFDLMRNGLVMNRNFCNNPLEITVPQCSLVATDPKTIAPIPQAEISANPQLAGQQNTGY
jgi:hypothetical protein